MTLPTWELALAHYSEEDRETLEAAAEAQAERIEKAALDLSCTGVVDGIDISELWFAVERRRAELVNDAPAPAEEPVVAPVAPVEEEPAQEPSKDVPEAEEAPDGESPPEAPEEAPKPKPKGRPRKSA